MKKNYIVLLLLFVVSFSISLNAQQVPNPGFEDWSGAKYDGQIQPKDWYASNVTQVGFSFNFAHQESGHSGSYSMMVQDQEVGAMGITEPAPGYFSLGHPWTHLPSITEINKATAGTYGGITWKYRPDSMSVWIKRTGNNTDKEDFYLLYYAWTGTAKGSKYKGKNGSCTSISQTNEESDIRIALDANECGTDQVGEQVAEGMWRERKTYGEWTNIRVPIYYFNNNTPTMMNIIFSASNYPNFRDNSGLYVGNSLYVDDVELIYSSKIQKLYIGGKEWKGFNPNSTEEQIYSLGRNATTIPEIRAMRGAGRLSNVRGDVATFPGRELSGSEISIKTGEIDGAATTITVKSEDGKSTTTYKLKFVRQASSNANLANIYVNDLPLANFNTELTNYNVELPYGTTTAPVVSAEKAEDEQTVAITQATSVTGTATLTVTAADKKNTKTYSIKFKVGQLSDNTLADIKINGESLPGFTPNQTIYRVSLPTSTTTMPTVEAVSAYPAGEQTIEYVEPNTIDGGTYQIKVSTPGNPTPKIYKLTFKLEASSYSYLKSLQMGENLITDFMPDYTTYFVNLPIGTTQLPEITYEKGESTQQVTVQEGGLNGTSKVTVIAGNGINKTEYKISVSTAVSEISTLNMIYVGGEELAGFEPNKTSYTYSLPVGTTTLPEITYTKGDEYQVVNVTAGSVNGTTRITVAAGNGATTQYQITFKVQQATNASLQMIYLDGTALAGFEPDKLEYNCPLPQGTTQLPVITYDQMDAYQTVTVRSGGLNGDYRITVRSQSGASQTYVLHFSVATSDNVNLSMIYLDGQELEGFDPAVTHYIDSLPIGISTIPSVTYTKGDPSQKVFSLLNNATHTLTVTSESGTTKTYTIEFVIQRSQSASLKMIYLDGDSLENFDPATLSYRVTLLGETRPKITVDKEEGQQVTIIAPQGAGIAKIYVKPEAAPANTYLIEFVGTIKSTALLDSIYVNGQPLAGFQPNTFEYSISYEDVIPEITYACEQSQQVSVLRNNNTIRLYVKSEGDVITYTITLNKIANNTTTLRGIYLDGQALEGFAPTTKHYTVSVAAGEKVPTVSFEKDNEKQATIAGPIDDTHYGILVRAVNGDTCNYMLTFDKQKYSDATLLSLEVEGMTIDFDPNKTEYAFQLAEGQDLPKVTIQARAKQHVTSYCANKDEYHIIVTAENGNQNTYKIHYARTTTNSAFLKDILIDGTSIANFHQDTLQYVDTLPWRSKVVPCVQPIGTDNQVITTYHSSINGTTHIHVESLNKASKKDYYIHFPVRKSSNAALEYIDSEIPFDFDPEKTDYSIQVPQGMTYAPIVTYQGQEPEQQIRYIARPLGATSQLIVTAEDGTQRTYNITFLPTLPDANNTLKSLRIKELGVELDPAVANHTVELPYGATTMTVEYEKTFAEQTVWVIPGGTKKATTIRVKSNRAQEQDWVYTITPNVSQQSPAVLDTILVDGVLVTNFDKNRFSYIYNRTQKTVPQVSIKKADGVEVETVGDIWHWSATVSKDGYTNTYTIYFHYTTDVVPNGEFTQWTTTNSSGTDKPTGWTVPGDIMDEYLGTAQAGPTVSKDGTSAVHLNTQNWAALAGSVPAVINLGGLAGSFAVAGGTRVVPLGFIGFHNTPDQAIINYKYTNHAGNGALFRFKFYDLGGQAHDFDYRQTSEVANYREVSIPLNTSELLVSGLDIIVDATGKYPESSSSADLYIDYIRFAYNHTLTDIKVNGQKASKSGNNFNYTLKATDSDLLPNLQFIGEVPDQAQQIVWSDETIDANYATRTATITNYAEDGSSSEYTLTINRLLNSDCALQGILVDGKLVSGFSADKTQYTVVIPSSQMTLPDVQPILSNKYQNATISYKDSTYTIKVQSEKKGVAKLYTIKIVSQLSNDTELATIAAEGITFDPTVKEYTITADKMPTISFEKKMDGQVVDLNNGVLTVTAEDGTTATYTILLNKPNIDSNCELSEIEVDGLALQNFSSTTYEYTLDRPNTIAFKRAVDSDSVIFEQTPVYMKLIVGTGEKQKTYTITYSSSIQSNDATLHAILVNNTLLEGFTPQSTSYTYHTDSTTQVEITAHPRAKSVKIETNHTDSCLTYLYTVIAEDGTMGQPYQLDIKPQLTSEAELQNVLINGKPVPYFHSDSTYYVITLPTPTAKVEELIIPDIEYIPVARRQKVEIEHGNLGETTNLLVTSEDAANHRTYQLMIQAEPSHNATLSNIVINGSPITDFRPNRNFYAVQLENTNVEIAWASDDNFQKVELSNDSNIYYLQVTAQDGVTINTYEIEVYTQPISSDATLADIQLDGKSLHLFYPELNSQLEFSSMQQRYNINLPAGTVVLPEISAVLREEGQQVETVVTGDTIRIHVTAADAITTNTYTFFFNVPMSKNTQLAMIYLNGDSLQGFTPDRYTYFIDLPIGQTTMPQILPVVQEPSQTVVDSITGTLEKTLYVTAEDGTQGQYLLSFALTYSHADTLLAIYADTNVITGFQPDSFYYSYTLPVGTQYMPALSYQEADQWQTINESTIQHSDFKRTTLFEVVAMSGRKNTYTIEYEILKSPCDSLAMIYVGTDSLAAFDPATEEYYVHLAPGDTIAPFVDYDAMYEEYQNISDTLTTYSIANQRIGWKRTIRVEAQNGNIRQYHVYFIFTKELSTDVTLSQIYINGEALEGFDPENLNYLVTIQEEQPTPNVLAEKGHNLQSVSIVTGDTTYIHVTAEDTTQQATYTIIFQRELSSYSYLQAIYLNDTIIDGFRADSMAYDFTLPFGTLELPIITYDLGHQLQQVSVDTFSAEINGQAQTTIRLTVTAADQISASEYDIRMTIAHNDDCTLQRVTIKGETLAGFHADTLTYDIEYPIGTDSTELIGADDIIAIPTDSNATVTITQNEQTIIIQVIAQNEKDVRIYTINQHILLSSNALLADILLDSVSLRDFDPAITEYTYYITEAVPAVTAIAADSTATIDYGMYVANEPYHIYVTAADGTECVYTIYFVAATIQASASPTKHDVIIKHIPGTLDFAVATIRKNVSVGIYTAEGHLIYYNKVTEISQNNAIMGTNADGSEILLDTFDNSHQFSVPQAGKVFFYVFYENDKRRIASGKLFVNM